MARFNQKSHCASEICLGKGEVISVYNGVSIVRWKKRKPCREPFVTYAIVWLKMLSIVAVGLILLTLHTSNGYHGGANIMTEACWCSSMILIQSLDLALDPVTFFHICNISSVALEL